ncbi:VRR-NUC domain-containing protein [Enterobacter kobei]|uniref:VRR-NUC domain-containing protein n=1 Tax=Enterobacter kobei TaxID=208224 RepID=UPI0021C1ED5A|nr:VRR-NUC domain-containing protein [Enterobacter kobei]UXJ66687.1 VRR-NUC domain-containing protein [Enterobacter kobei]
MSRNLFSVEWLEGHKQRMASSGRKRKDDITVMKGERVLRESYNRLSQSPHLKALNILERNPGLLEGNAEHYEQVRILWHFEQHNPALYALLHATPNGGQRSKATAGKMKAEGQKRGYPDLSLDKARGVYHGMRLELKYGKNRLSEEQKGWLKLLESEGYYCAVAYGHEQAISLFVAYWALKRDERMDECNTDKLWH